MNKKQTQKKHDASQKLASIGALLKRGNYYDLRKVSHRVLASTDSIATEIDAARQALKISWPEPIALLAGFLCLVFSMVILFLSAY